MPAVKILHMADLHIGATESFLGEKSSSRRIESLLTFEKAVDIAKENSVELFLIAGDLLDTNKCESSFAERILSKISSAEEIKFVYSAGNHDPLNSDSPFLKAKLPPNFYIMPTKDSCIEVLNGVKVYGKSFAEILQKGEERFSVPADENTVNIMCIHGCFGISGEHNPISDSFVINSGMDYIALGHIHKRTEPQKLGNTYIAYSGCAEAQGFDEPGEKGVYIGEVGKNYANLSFVRTTKRIHITEKTDVTGLSSETEIADKIIASLKEKYGENFSENLYKIILVGETEIGFIINKNEIAERIKEQTYFAAVSDETSVRIDLEAIKNEMTLKGIFVKKMLEKADSDFENKPLYEKALKLGLKAFAGEVSFDEN